MFDSDDRCMPDALQIFKQYWEDIPLANRKNFSTLSVLCMDKKGNIVGGEYPEQVSDIKSVKQQFVFRSKGERWGVNTTQSMRENKFPVFPGERFIPEGIIWNRLSKNYSARFVNKPLRIYEAEPGGLTANNVLIRMRSPKGTVLSYQERLKLPIGIKRKCKTGVNFVRFSLHGRLIRNLAKWTFSSLFVFVALPAGCIFYCYDKLKYRAL